MPPSAYLSRIARRWRALALPLVLWAVTLPAQAAVVISQVYGGGGNTGATWRNDFIELLNTGSSAENIGGWSVQYASATGGTWQVTGIPANTLLPAGRYLLIQQAAGTGGTTALPTPDVIGTIAMSGSTGKVALVRNTTALSGATPPTTLVADAIGYGPTASFAEGSPTPALNNTTAALRKAAGCTDSQSNSADFDLGAPLPRNTATAAVVCANGGGGGAPPTDLAIYTLQGSGAASPVAGQRVRTTGVVTKLANGGFFIQDLVGDNDPATSDGIFVLADPAGFSAAQPGNLVRVTGTVTEFASGAGTAATPLTELTAVSLVELQGTGQTITPTLLSLPLAAGDSFERFEGMLVQINQTLTVQQNFFLARFGQITVGAGGRHEKSTNRHRPGSAQALDLAALQARSQLLLDDGSAQQNPNPTPYAGADGLPRAGDTLGPITGVLDFGLATSIAAGPGLYRIHPTSAAVFTASNPRPANPPAVGGNLRVASMNVLNFFTTFTTGGTADGATGQVCSLGSDASAAFCRGANSLDEFLRQRDKIVKALAGLNADAVGLMEIQNNGSTAAQNLVDALNAQVGAGTYAVVPDPAAAGSTGTDAIKVAMIYKPARLARVGGSASDTDAINNRPPLAQTFAAANGERFTLVVNHLKSKGSCPASGADSDSGDGQGCWNATRLQQAQRLRTVFVPQLQGASGSPDVLLIGDFNAYGQEDPINDLTSNGYVDQMGRFNALAYSYVFDGTAGRLDHGISSASLSARVAGAQHWHIDADESLAQDYNREFKQPACAACAPDPYDGTLPFRASDHDPAVIGLHLYKTFTGTASRDQITGTPGDDILIGGVGADILTGGAGTNLFVYTSMRDAGDTVTDFVPGKDFLDLRLLLSGLGYAGNNPVADGWVQFVAVAAGTSVQIDADGRASAAVFRPLLTLAGVSPASLSATRDLIVR